MYDNNLCMFSLIKDFVYLFVTALKMIHGTVSWYLYKPWWLTGHKKPTN